MDAIVFPPALASTTSNRSSSIIRTRTSLAGDDAAPDNNGCM